MLHLRKKNTYGKGIEITTSRNSKSLFSNSYSTLTSQVPFPAGEGQHVTYKENM